MSQIYSTKPQRVDYGFDPDTIDINTSITASSYTHNVNSGNGDHGNGDDCDNNGDFGIGDTYDDVSNGDDRKDGDDGSK